MSVELWAEAGPCDKSVDKALQYAEAISMAGATAMKVQWYHPDRLVIPDAPRYDNTGGPAKTQHEAFSGAIYPYTEWEPVIDWCRSNNLKFIPSVFDLEAVQAANHFELPTLKIASGDITYHKLIQEASSGRQVALSTGAATLQEVADAVEALSYSNAIDHILMACHLEYPTPYHRANLARAYALQASFPHLIPGFSDHTPGDDTIPLIVAMGCQVIEKHFTLKQFEGYDSDFALDPDALARAVQRIQGTLGVMGNADIEPDPDEEAAREGARRSPYAARDIKAGEVIEPGDIAILRPYYGVNPQHAARYVGRSYEHDIPKHGQLPEA